MKLRFCSLASGSRGNALLVEADDTLILIDCGIARRTLEARMGAVGCHPNDINAVLVTHEHSDHMSGVAKLVRKTHCPVYASHGTARSLSDIEDHRTVHQGVDFEIGNIRVHPFPVPHDAREPLQYRFEAGGRTLGILTDTGHISMHVAETLADVDALAVEFNHDFDSLSAGPYPGHLKARVGSNFGHLNNAQAAGLLDKLDHTRLQWVVALHMSEQNNSADHVDASVAAMREQADFDFRQATQGEPTGWFELS